MTQILQNAQWDQFQALRTRMSRNGLAMMPTAGAFPQVAQVVAFNGGLEFDIVAFQAAKRGGPPTVPAPSTTNPNRVFLGGDQTAPFPIPDMGNIRAYGVGGWYIWGILAPEGLESDFMIGNLPFPGLDQNEFIPSSFFAYNLINQRIVRKVGGLAVPNEAQAIQNILRKFVSGGG